VRSEEKHEKIVQYMTNLTCTETWTQYSWSVETCKRLSIVFTFQYM